MNYIMNIQQTLPFIFYYKEFVKTKLVVLRNKNKSFNVEKAFKWVTNVLGN